MASTTEAASRVVHVESRRFQCSPDCHCYDVCACRCGHISCIRIPVSMLKIYFSTFFCMFSNAYANTMLFPFLPFMVRFLLPEIDESSTGRYTGIIAGSMSFGKFCTNLLWGAVSDSVGRKPVLLINLSIVGTASVVFGFSVNFPMAVAMILLQGLGNSILSTISTVLAESSTDKNRAFGMSLLTVGWAVGMIIGPAVSGVLADPVGQYNLTISNEAIQDFLTSYPFLPPCLVHFMICLTGVGIVLCWLPETRKTKRVSVPEDTLTSHNDLPLLSDVEMEDRSDAVTVQLNTRGKLLHWLKDKQIAFKKFMNSTKINLQFLSRDKVVWRTVIIFCFMQSSTIMFDEVYPLWACIICLSCLFSAEGGIQFKVYEIGVSLTVVGVVIIPINLLLYPCMERKLGSITTFHIGAVQLIVAQVLMPNIHYLVLVNSTILWSVLLVCLLTVHVNLNVCAPACFLFINNSVTFDKLGTLSGFSTSVAALFRVVGPPLIGILYSLSLSDTARRLGFPLDYHLVFVLLALSWLVIMLLVASLPTTINKQKQTVQ